MKLKNISKTIIGVGTKFIMPNQTIEVDESVAKNVMVKKLIKVKKLAIARENTKVVKNASTVKEEFLAMVDNEASATKMKNFAKRNGISLEGVTNDEDIPSVISATLVLAEKNEQ